jgi:ATP-binding cassette subfamily B protein
MGFGAVALMIYYAGQLNEMGTLQVGEVSSFLIYMIMLIANFGMVAGVFGNVMQLVGAADMICVLMEYKPRVNTQGGERIEKEDIGGNLELEDVHFRYPSKPDVHVLKGISFAVNAS